MSIKWYILTTTQAERDRMKKALAITTLGEVKILDLSDKSLETLQEAVGGYVQAIDLSDTMSMWCNEEGKMMSMPHNPFGQAFWEKVYGRTDYIVGDIVLTGGTDKDGETMGLNDKQVKEISIVVASVSDFISPRITVI